MDAGVTELILAAVISGGVVSVVLTFVLRVLFDRRLTTVSEEIKTQFEQQALVYRSNREWRERSVAELLGPVYMQLDRSNRAFGRWETRNDFLEGKVVKDANTQIRDLLLAKGNLLPAHLVEHAGDLIEHYDRWLEEYALKREGPEADIDTSPVYVGPKGYPFPDDADRAFKETFLRMRRELYETDAPR
ncbi:MAG: hypothetical protein ACRDNA_11620, partial [Gaiellaceae bacterium]